MWTGSDIIPKEFLNLPNAFVLISLCQVFDVLFTHYIAENCNHTYPVSVVHAENSSQPCHLVTKTCNPRVIL